jgi:hypothetical protein
VFQEMVERLVAFLQIPPSAVQVLAAGG